MIAVKYGTVPVARAVGGLIDTVFGRDYSARPVEERNGYVFHRVDNRDSELTVFIASSGCGTPTLASPELMINGMRQDHSWAGPGQHYLNVYEYIRHK
jgi:starch synthase